MHYWTHIFTWRTWQEFLHHPGGVVGFPERRWPTVQQIAPGDVLLCYLLGVSRYVGLLDVTGPPFLGHSPIWSERIYPARVPVHVRLDLLPEYGIPVTDLGEQLSYFHRAGRPRDWGAHFRSAPVAETAADAAIIIDALEVAAEDPTFRPYDARKLQRRVKLYETGDAVYTIPENAAEDDTQPVDVPPADPPSHDEIQWLMLNMGSEMGLDVWVARNDRGRAFAGQDFADIPRLLPELPRQFDPATQRTIELIDVLWLRENALVAAFEIEHTSAVYSGLLRLADLLAMQPNLNLRLYIVAPDDRREKVFMEINRPAFARSAAPLGQLCRFLPYSALIEKARQAADLLPYLQPDFLHDIAEPVSADV